MHIAHVQTHLYLVTFTLIQTHVHTFTHTHTNARTYMHSRKQRSEVFSGMAVAFVVLLAWLAGGAYAAHWHWGTDYITSSYFAVTSLVRALSVLCFASCIPSCIFKMRISECVYRFHQLLLVLLLRFQHLPLTLLLLQSTGGFFTPPKTDDLSLWMTGVFVLVSHVLLNATFLSI